MKRPLLGMTFGTLLLAAIDTAANGSPKIAALGPDDFAFSVSNMNPAVDPGDDFLRYAAGGWLDRVERPADKASFGFMTVMTERIGTQMTGLLAQAAETAGDAPIGSPNQQVGTLYNAYLDVETIDSRGMAPLRGELDRLDALDSKDALAGYLGHFSAITGRWPFFKVEIFEDLSDATQSAVYLEPGARAIPIGAIFESPADSPLAQVYKDYIAGMLDVAGYSEARAEAIANASLAIDTVLHGGEMDPVKKIDVRNMNNPRGFAELQAETPPFDFDRYFAALGLDRPDRVILTDPEFTAAVSRVLDEFPLEDIKGYLALRLIQGFADVLTTDFDEPRLAINAAIFGAATRQPREEKVVTFLQGALGQPLGRLYVENFFDRATQEKALDMVRLIQATFRARVEANEWMSPETRAAALEKVDSLYYRVGYPDEWIDYSDVAISDDLVQSLVNIRRFEMSRLAEQQGRPMDRWAFSDPGHTLPTIVNAAYNPSINGFEVTAAIAQPPAFQADMDAPVWFCRLGATVGHEITHGFDSGGRNFDADGNLRNWWTDADAERFDAETQKLIRQGEAYEALPDTYMNGSLTVTENLADMGGISVAHDALMTWLEAHPEENVEIDGLTPSQRCFIAWAQIWAEKRSDASMMTQLEDNHAPGNYRATAPLRHIDAFYEAFGIGPDEPMWLEPGQRVNIW